MKFTLLGERERFRGRVFTLVDREVVLPNGRRTVLNIVDHPGAVAIVPVYPDGDVVLLRQFRLAAGGEIWEIPAGTREPGEAPARTARRELAEEAGLRAGRWTKLGDFFTAPGFCTERMILYLARDLGSAPADGDPDEVLRPHRIAFREALRMIDRGLIRDAKTIAGLYMAERRLNGRTSI